MTGTGWDGLATVMLVLMFGEALLGVVCVVAATVLLVRRQKERALGLVAGWLLGLCAAGSLVWPLYL